MKSLRLLDKLYDYIYSDYDIKSKDNQVDENLDGYLPSILKLLFAEYEEQPHLMKNSVEQILNITFPNHIWNLIIFSWLLISLGLILYTIIFIVKVFAPSQTDTSAVLYKQPNQSSNSLKTGFLAFTVLLFFLSFFWEFNRLYQIEISKRAAVTLTVSGVNKSSIRYIFLFTIA